MSTPTMKITFRRDELSKIAVSRNFANNNISESVCIDFVDLMSKYTVAAHRSDVADSSEYIGHFSTNLRRRSDVAVSSKFIGHFLSQFCRRFIAITLQIL